MRARRKMPRMSLRALLLPVAAAWAICACAGFAPADLPPGATVDQAIARMGAPTGRYRMSDGGERVEFARGPTGRHTYMLDFDASGRLVRSEQVLTERHFLELRIGMTSDEVLRRIGRPSDVRFLPRQQHQLWSYRYETPFCIWYQVSLDTANRVVELGNNLDPMCERGDGRFSLHRRP